MVPLKISARSLAKMELMKLAIEAGLRSGDYSMLKHLENLEKILSSQYSFAEQLGSAYAFHGDFLIEDAQHDLKNVSPNVKPANSHERLDSTCPKSLIVLPENDSLKFKGASLNINGGTTSSTVPRYRTQEESLEQWPRTTEHQTSKASESQHQN